MRFAPTPSHRTILVLILIFIGSLQIAKGQSESGSSSIEGVVKDTNGGSTKKSRRPAQSLLLVPRLTSSFHRR